MERDCSTPQRNVGSFTYSTPPVIKHLSSRKARVIAVSTNDTMRIKRDLFLMTDSINGSRFIVRHQQRSVGRGEHVNRSSPRTAVS